MINITNFFTAFGKFCNAGNTIQTALQTTIEDEVEDAVQAIGASLGIEFESARNAVLASLRALQESGLAAQVGCVQTPMHNFLIETVKADNPQAADTVELAVDELIKQMLAQSETLDASTPNATASYGSGNTGDGIAVLSSKRWDGKANEHILEEDIEGIITASPTNGLATLSLAGEAPVDKLAYNWPQGSGAAAALTSHTGASSANLVANGTFETEDDNEEDLPQGWVASVATLGTTLKLTNVEVQTVTISSTPTGGYYLLHWTDGAGNAQTTAPIAYNAGQSEVQTALRALKGLEQVTVVTTGTVPDYTHTITFTGVPGPAQLTSSDFTTGGSIAHATTDAGSAHVLRGARAVEFDSNGSELTSLNIPVALQPRTLYGVAVWMKVDSVPAAGGITIDIADGIGGTNLADDEGGSNTIAVDCTALSDSAYTCHSAIFITPTVMPATVYFRVRITVAVSNTSSVFMDEAIIVPATQLYVGGPSAALFTGPTLWSIGDTVTIAATNNRAGALHEWANRIYNLRDRDLLLPTDKSGSETQDDALIS